MLRILIFWTASLFLGMLFDKTFAKAGMASIDLSAGGAQDLEKRSSFESSMAMLNAEEKAKVSSRKRHLGHTTKKRSENEGYRVSDETSKTAGRYSPADIEISIFEGGGVYQSLKKVSKEDEDVGESVEKTAEVKETAVTYGVLENFWNQEDYEEKEHDEGQESDENSADVIRTVTADRVFEKTWSKRGLPDTDSLISFGELINGE